MDFRPTEEQVGFAQALGALMDSADSASVARSWAAGDYDPGQQLWRRLAEQGVCALLIGEESGGMGGQPSDMIAAFEVLGNKLAVGPFIESAAFLAVAHSGAEAEALAEGTMSTLAMAGPTPYALDAMAATKTWFVDGDTLCLAEPGTPLASVDTTRHLFEVSPTTLGAAETASSSLNGVAIDEAFNMAALACAAQLLGAGERLLADTVEYVKQRKQYGRIVGSYQALKHRLAEVRIALDFARPLVHGASLSIGGPTGSRDVSAAKLGAADAAYLSSRVALQLHGAIGYTAEFDLGLWINRVRALQGAWGSSDFHRARIAAELVGA